MPLSKANKNALTLDQEYKKFLQQIKNDIRGAQIKAIRSLNRELMWLYLTIGRSIVEKQEQYGWGKSIVKQLAKDLRREFPNKRGFSDRNLWDMRRFYETYREKPDLQKLAVEIPWGQNLLIINKIKDQTIREYYLKNTAEFGWTRNVLLHHINGKAYERQLLTKQHNFQKALPEHLAEQANEAMKDIYIFDSLGLTQPILERELESRMIEKIRDVILELGYGFSFIGNQYKVTLEENEYFIDLLFFHRKLKCLVAIELKAGKFTPEYAGKMNFYLNILDDFVREEEENPSIGIILCAERNHIEVEYALRNINKPIGVAQYQLTRHLPQELADKLPDAKKLEQEILQELGG